MIPIIQFPPTKCCQQQSMNHVAVQKIKYNLLLFLSHIHDRQKNDQFNVSLGSRYKTLHSMGQKFWIPTNNNYYEVIIDQEYYSRKSIFLWAVYFQSSFVSNSSNHVHQFSTLNRTNNSICTKRLYRRNSSAVIWSSFIDWCVSLHKKIQPSKYIWVGRMPILE